MSSVCARNKQICSMEDIPTDVIQIILRYLTDDPISVCRLEQSCRHYKQVIQKDNELFEDMMKELWIKSSDGDAPQEGDARQQVERRWRLDTTATNCVRGMAEVLREELGEQAVSMNGYDKVGDTWDHPHWKLLLSLRCNVQDALKSIANATIDYSKEVLKQNLTRFLAARAIVSIHTLECIYELQMIKIIETHDDTRDCVMERLSLVAVKAQMTPPELLRETKPIEKVVSDQLDKIAAHCLERVNAVDYTTDKLQMLIVLLFDEMGFGGNEEDYYNYKNSLLNHVMETKKGIPITLAILFTCIARRLLLKVDMIGLPGHLVLGFYDDLKGEQRFLDVFHGGRILDLHDCRNIAASYGFTWHASFIRPLAPYQVFKRTLNNLSNCHSRRLAITMQQPAFHAMLSFQERVLMLVHEQPRVAVLLLDRLSQDLPLTLSAELLKLCGLLWRR